MESTIDQQDEYCGGSSCEAPIASAVAVLSGRWSVAVIEAIHFAGGTARFRELQGRIEGISPKELTRQLLHLVAQGVLSRGPSTRPGYALTGRGRRLLGHMDALGQWAKEDGAFDPAPCQQATWLGPLQRRPPPGNKTS